MTQSTISESSWVNIDINKFEDVTTITHKKKVWTHIGSNSHVQSLECRLGLLRTAGKDVLFLYVYCWANLLGKTLHPEAGKLLVKCDENVHQLHFAKSMDEIEKLGDTPAKLYTITYLFSVDGLKAVCDAKAINLRWSDGDIYVELPSERDEQFTQLFQKHCQQFYNNVFDNSLYKESVAGGPSDSGGCFIATAAMGAYDDPAVRVLSNFRDEVLLRSIAGRRFVQLYYKYSPPIATAIRGKAWLCASVKWLVVVPASAVCKILFSKHDKNSHGLR